MIHFLFNIGTGFQKHSAETSGQSYTYKYEVTKLIGERIGNTVWLSLLTLIFNLLNSITIRMIAGRYQNSWADKAIVVYTFITYQSQYSYSH